MTCFTPLQGWWASKPNHLGNRYVTFSPHYALRDMPVAVPCSGCLGCRLDSSKSWAIRGEHEARLHGKSNCSFLTLTYKNSRLPVDGMIHLDEMQDFMKRLRINTGKKLSMIYSGEYGDKTNRPHYHLIIFGENFKSDARPYKRSHHGFPLWNSDLLDATWQGRGHAVVGNFSFLTAAYVARYILKKQTTRTVFPHRFDLDEWCTSIETGEVFNRAVYEFENKTQPFAQASRRPAIGRDFALKYLSDIYPADHCIINSKPCRPPRYYDRLLKDINPDMFASVKRQRSVNARNYDTDDTTRLRARMAAKAASVSRLIRSLD